eukprot:scaffold209012_cov25-Prasinocladus_malaysianus.AAC.1
MVVLFSVSWMPNTFGLGRHQAAAEFRFLSSVFRCFASQIEGLRELLALYQSVADEARADARRLENELCLASSTSTDAQRALLREMQDLIVEAMVEMQLEAAEEAIRESTQAHLESKHIRQLGAGSHHNSSNGSRQDSSGAKKEAQSQAQQQQQRVVSAGVFMGLSNL